MNSLIRIILTVILTPGTGQWLMEALWRSADRDSVFIYRKMCPLSFLIHQDRTIKSVLTVAVVPFLFLDKMQLNLHFSSSGARSCGIHI